MTINVSATSSALTCAPVGVTRHELVCAPPPAASGCTVASRAAPGVGDCQSALNDFGRMVVEAYKGKNFDPQDKARFDQVLSGYD